MTMSCGASAKITLRLKSVYRKPRSVTEVLFFHQILTPGLIRTELKSRLTRWIVGSSSILWFLTVAPPEAQSCLEIGAVTLYEIAYWNEDRSYKYGQCGFVRLSPFDVWRNRVNKDVTATLRVTLLSRSGFLALRRPHVGDHRGARAVFAPVCRLSTHRNVRHTARPADTRHSTFSEAPGIRGGFRSGWFGAWQPSS